MAIIKTTQWPLLAGTNWITDFFDNERFFDSEWMKKTQVVPAVNVNERDKEFEIEVAAPGMKKSDFKITTENGMLTVSSEQQESKEEKEKDFIRREFNFSSFMRSFNLPENCIEEKIAANYADGVLKITIPKKVVAKEKISRPIEVH
jgi:HSP20 family protein